MVDNSTMGMAIAVALVLVVSLFSLTSSMCLMFRDIQTAS